jgi:hypothetical protein
MRSLERNKTKIYYALLNSKNEIRDEYGNFTGEYELQYGNPIAMKASVSAAMGETYTRQFGEQEAYDKVVIADDPLCLIDEYAILWVDNLPVIKRDKSTDTPHDYVVKKVAKSINVSSYAIAKVEVQ